MKIYIAKHILKSLMSFCIISLLLSLPLYGQGFEHFISRKGTQLMDGDRVFRFVSFNIPNLNYVEDEMAFHTTNPYGLPNEYEMRDAFATIKEMGGQVIRMYTFPVFSEAFPKDAPTYVEAPGKFNERAFRTMDTLLALANEYQIRVIIPFINNWKWMGGRPDFAAFYGKKEDDFWTDPDIIKGFKKTIKYILNRKNTVTGVRYKNDKAILCWQSGNELQNPSDWLIDIAKFVKSIDKNHLFMDGYHAINDLPFREASINSDYVDIITGHHYEEDPAESLRNLRKKLAQLDNRKPLIVTEFGFVSTQSIQNFLDTIIQNPNIPGALIWSLRYRHRNGGFYWHSEPAGLGLYKAYHWPGFSTGNTYDEEDLMRLMRKKAFAIQDKKAPPVSIPETPYLFPIESISCIKWRGVMGASGYNIERATSPEGPWTMIAFNESDAKYPVFPGFHDKDAELGQSYYYRVSAMNMSGVSPTSNIVGPILAKSQKVIDNMENVGDCYHYYGDLIIEQRKDRSYKEDLSRMTGQNGAEIIYHVPGNFKQMDVFAFEKESDALVFFASYDNETYFPIEVDRHIFHNNEKNYDYALPIHYLFEGDSNIKFLKIHFKKKTSLSRVEVEYMAHGPSLNESFKP